MRISRGRSGQLRNRYIGNGKYREIAAEAAKAEAENNLEDAAALWADAFRVIDERYPQKAATLREYVNNRIHFCQVWGTRYRNMAALSMEKQTIQ